MQQSHIYALTLFCGNNVVSPFYVDYQNRYRNRGVFKQKIINNAIEKEFQTKVQKELGNKSLTPHCLSMISKKEWKRQKDNSIILSSPFYGTIKN